MDSNLYPCCIPFKDKDELGKLLTHLDSVPNVKWASGHRPSGWSLHTTYDNGYLYIDSTGVMSWSSAQIVGFERYPIKRAVIKEVVTVTYEVSFPPHEVVVEGHRYTYSGPAD